MKKALFIGGTGTISAAITRQLSQMNSEWELFLINRGTRREIVPENVQQIIVDINNEEAVAAKLEGMHFDCVCNFIAFEPFQIERDYRLFKDKTYQYIFISSASAYMKPVSGYIITEGTPLSNPYWEYSRNKIACEELLMHLHRNFGFPVTIVRPSHTYDERALPLAVHGNNGTWQVAKRIIDGKPVIIHGDGASLWTLTHNSDFAQGFVGLMGNIHTIGEPYQITSDESVTWNQIYNEIAKCLGKPLKACYVPSDFLAEVSNFDLMGELIGDKTPSVVFDNTKLKRVVPGFSAKIRFDQGIRQTIDYILSHPECQKEDKEFDAWCDRVVEAVERCKSELKSLL